MFHLPKLINKRLLKEITSSSSSLSIISVIINHHKAFHQLLPKRSSVASMMHLKVQSISPTTISTFLTSIHPFNCFLFSIVFFSVCVCLFSYLLFLKTRRSKSRLRVTCLPRLFSQSNTKKNVKQRETNGGAVIFFFLSHSIQNHIH